MKRSRQLAAIMFTDIQGYTSLMQQNEEKAVQARIKHREIFNSVTEKHSGRILQYFGDGTLSIFGSAVDAVNCAIEMQIDFQKDPAVPVRIGIHTGDVILSDEEIIGDGVNIASRIESLALPGSVLISDKVYDELKNQQSIKTAFLKAVQFKNVVKPIEIYAVANEGLVIPGKEDLIGSPGSHIKAGGIKAENKKGRDWKIFAGVSAIVLLIAALFYVMPRFAGGSDYDSSNAPKSIAVLPFVNMSNDPQQEYFSDGISEEILNSLVNVTGLKVAGRTSAFSFKGKNEDIRFIGDELGVEMVLEGSVRKSGNNVRITAQLISVKDGYHLWSETYDRELEDIIAVQEDIAGQIVEKLKIQVGEKSKQIVNPPKVEAYEMLMKGRYFFHRDFGDKKKALEYFQKAVEIDPDYAEAHAYIGETYLHYSGFNLMQASDAYSRARAYAKRAITLNKFEPRAHKVLAYIHLFYDWDWDAALSDYNRAIDYGLTELNEFILFYDIFVNDDFDHAIGVAHKRVEIDPLSIESNWQVGLCYYFAENFEEALKYFDESLELDPDYSNGHQWRGITLAYLGRYDEAVASMEKAIEITKGEALANLELLAVKILMGKKDEVLPVLEKGDFIDPMDAARLYTMLGMEEEAIDWIEKGYSARSVMMVSLKHLWFWDPLRGNKRFIEIYNRMNF